MLSVKQAAKYACVSEALVRGWLREGLPHFRLGAKGRRGKIVIREADLEAFLSVCRVEAAGASPKPVVSRPSAGFVFLPPRT